MCGILLAVQRQEDVSAEFEATWELLKLANSARGPDAQDIYRTVVASGDGSPLDVRIFASELRLRGDRPIVQPHKNSELRNVFCWNGEVFEGLELDASENDGARLFQDINNMRDFEKEFPVYSQGIEGPYAFTNFDSESKRIYFGRDPLGRRSLLVHRPTRHVPLFLAMSVSAGCNHLFQLEEVTTECLHCLELGKWDLSGKNTDASHFLRALSQCEDVSSSGSFGSVVKINDLVTDTPPMVETVAMIPEELANTVDDFLSHISRSVRLQVCDVPYHGKKEQARIAILFSGGIDSTMLAYMADRHLPPDEPIDLLNVAFENPRKIQVRTESTGNAKKQRRKQVRVPMAPEDGNDKAVDTYLVPDRVTGLEELVELRKLCPRRQWNFVEVDVTFEETLKFRPIVEALMFPCRTVMDLSLGLALYFASRGDGHVRKNYEGPKVPYISAARVLINGLGSDELLGGYGRHRTAFNSGGWPSVIDELQLEIYRIPTRNLGRDDRIISSHGKEGRHPFLSLSVVHFLASLPVHHKMDPRLPIGLGDKTLLRLAASKVGLELASTRRKRAMQFGSHSARMEAGEAERRGDSLLR